jgi:hypothetical protein
MQLNIDPCLRRIVAIWKGAACCLDLRLQCAHNLFRNTTPIEPYLGHPGWNLITAMADEAVHHIKSAAPREIPSFPSRSTPPAACR